MLADQKTEDHLAKTSVISEGGGTQKLEPSCSQANGTDPHSLNTNRVFLHHWLQPQFDNGPLRELCCLQGTAIY